MAAVALRFTAGENIPWHGKYKPFWHCWGGLSERVAMYYTVMSAKVLILKKASSSSCCPKLAKAGQPYRATSYLILQAEAVVDHFSCSERMAQAAHREGQWNVVAASHQLLPVPLDLLLLSQLLVVLNQFVNLEGGKGIGSTVTSAAALHCELAGVLAIVSLCS